MRFAEIIPGLLAGKKYTADTKWDVGEYFYLDGKQLMFDTGGEYIVNKTDLECNDFREYDEYHYTFLEAMEKLKEGKKVRCKDSIGHYELRDGVVFWCIDEQDSEYGCASFSSSEIYNKWMVIE